MQTFKQKLLKYYSWVYALLTFLIWLKIFPNPFLPLFVIYLMALLELALKKNVNGQLVKKDFKELYFLVIVTIIIFIMVWLLQQSQ